MDSGYRHRHLDRKLTYASPRYGVGILFDTEYSTVNDTSKNLHVRMFKERNTVKV
jgi:hypothetical protein